MTQPSPREDTVHILSQRSISKNWDIFLFYNQTINYFEMRAGLDSRKHNVTIASFYRWISLVHAISEDREDFIHIWPVTIIRHHVLIYSCERVGEPLPRSSQALLAPGDYAAYYDDGEGEPVGVAIGPQYPYPSLTKRRQFSVERMLASEGSQVDRRRLAFNDIPPNVIANVEARDEGVCLITGKVSNQTEICWVLPPAWSRQYDISHGPEEYQTEDNLITIDVNLVEAFYENKFGIDFEDGYRIVVFEKFPGSDELAGQRINLQALAKFNGQQDRFFLGHFKWTLRCQFIGGDIRVDYPDGAVDIMDDALINGIDPQAPIWNTRLGREILDVVERVKRVRR